MNGIVLGILFGTLFGLVAFDPVAKLASMDGRTAFFRTFTHRFAIGFLIPNALLFVDPLLRGMLLGLLLSLPDSIMTKKYVPILSVGIVGGLAIGALLKFLIFL